MINHMALSPCHLILTPDELTQLDAIIEQINKMLNMGDNIDKEFVAYVKGGSERECILNIDELAFKKLVGFSPIGKLTPGEIGFLSYKYGGLVGYCMGRKRVPLEKFNRIFYSDSSYNVPGEDTYLENLRKFEDLVSKFFHGISQSECQNLAEEIINYSECGDYVRQEINVNKKFHYKQYLCNPAEVGDPNEVKILERLLSEFPHTSEDKIVRNFAL
jgi:hypothetical protein